MIGIRPCNLDRAGPCAGLGQQQGFGEIGAHIEVRGRLLAQHDAVHRRRVAELVAGDEKVAVLLIGVRTARFQIGFFHNLLADRHHDGIAVGHFQGRVVMSHLLSYLA